MLVNVREGIGIGIDVVKKEVFVEVEWMLWRELLMVVKLFKIGLNVFEDNG